MWPALAIGFSPLWLDWLEHALERPWATYALLLLPLAVVAAWRAPRVRARPAFALGIVAALAIELAALAWGAPQRGRLALPLAWISACLAFGAAPLRVSLLALFWVPIPSLVFKATSPALEHAQIGVVVPALAGLGVEVARDAAWIVSGDQRLAVTRFHAGWNVLALAAGLFAAVTVSGRCRFSLPACAGAALGLAIGVQLGGLAAAALALSLAGPAPAERLLDHAWWAAIVLGAPLALRAMRPAEAPRAA